jgi:hypothetical protein
MSFTKHIKELNRKIIYNTPEFLGQYSQYRLDKIIHNYSTDSLQSYTLITTNASQNNSHLYCLSPKLPQIVNFSQFIKLYNLEGVINLLNIVDYGITSFNGKEIFGMILPYIHPEKLLCNNLELIAHNPLQYVIMPILETLAQLHNADLTHGCINQENIWLNFNQNNEVSGVTLSNTILELPGYNQNPIYEPVNRMLVHRSGKSSSKSADCYALGILLASLLSNQNITKKGYEATVKSRTKYGSYQSIIERYFSSNENCLDEAQRCILYWLLHDDPKKRWSAIEALKFLRRRHRSVTHANMLRAMEQDKQNTVSLVKPLTFSGEECYSMTEAAVSSIRHYDEIKIMVKNGKLVKELLANDSIKPDFISKISILRSLGGFEGNTAISKEDMFLTTFIILMNNSMPIKLKEIAVEANAVWQMSKYISTRLFTSLSNTLNKAIHLNVISKIHKMISSICGVEINSIDLPQLPVLDVLSEDGSRHFIYSYIEPSSVYVLNEKISFSTGDVLEILNSSDEDMLLETAENDQFIGYILGKLTRQIKLEVNNSAIFNPLEDRFALFFLILKACHSVNPKKSLPKLGEFLYKKLSTDYLQKIKHLKLRNKIDAKLKLAATVGDITQMYNILQSKKIDIMHAKYAKVAKLSGHIHAVNDNDAIMDHARQQTIRLAAACFIGILCLILYQIS